MANVPVKFLSEIALEHALQKYPTNERLLKLYWAVSPGKVERVDVRYSDGQEEVDWIKANRAKYKGKWVVLLGSRVLGMGDDLKTAMRMAREQQYEGTPLMHYLEFDCLGVTTSDVYLHDTAYWRNVQASVWEYTIGGYQVIKKWLSYREHALLGRALTTDEARKVTHMARCITAIVLLYPALGRSLRSGQTGSGTLVKPVQERLKHISRACRARYESPV